MPTPATTKETLLSLYQRLVAGALSADEALEAIEHRSRLGAALYAVRAVGLPQAHLDEHLPRLEAALEPNATLDPALDAAEREVARIQLEVVEAEQRRRAVAREAAEQGRRYAPTRPELLASMMGLDTGLREEGEQAHFHESFRRVVAAVRRALLNERPGSAVVVRALREASAQPADGHSHPIDPWVRSGVALELLAHPEKGIGGASVDVDPVTAAQAARAKRLLYAADRQDPRYEQVDWPLDLDGGEIATLLEDAAHANQRWDAAGYPETDRTLYTTPTRREELGRPAPSAFVVPEGRARALAEQAGGLPQPLVYAVHPRERARVARELWERGLPQPAKNQVGVPLYAAPGQMVGWGHPPFPYGVACAVALPDNFILRLGRPGADLDEDMFNRLSDQASDLATEDHDYPRILRELLLKAGYHAIARYDYLDGDAPVPQEILLLDPRPETTMVIRESVPSFVAGDRPVEVARARTAGAPRAAARAVR